MPIVVATLRTRPDTVEEVIDVYRRLIPRVHDEVGCELFSLHRGEGVVTLIERWTTASDLQAHSVSPVFQEISSALRGLLASRPEIQVLESIPAGTTTQGIVG